MKAWEILKKFGRCVDHSAEDRFGNPVLVSSPEAAKFCVYGATAKAYPDGDEYSRKITALKYHLAITLYGAESWEAKNLALGVAVTEWNRRKTDQQVIDTLKTVGI